MTAEPWDDVEHWGADETAPDHATDHATDSRPKLSAGDGADAGTDELELYYPTVAAFVHELLAPTYRRLIDGRTFSWCPQWWRHAEAIARLEALWRAWEHLRLDPATGASAWFRDHADHHMPVLLDAGIGPFKYCSSERGHTDRLEPLPLDAPPDGLFQALNG